MVPVDQIPKISVVSILITNPMPGLRSADFPRFVPPILFFDVSPFDYLSDQSVSRYVTATQADSTHIYYILASKVIQPPCQMGLRTVILDRIPNLVLFVEGL